MLSRNAALYAFISRPLFIAGFALLLTSAVLADKSKPKDMTNDDVIRLTELGIPPGMIIERIRANASTFQISDEMLAKLQDKGVYSEVILEMVAAKLRKGAPVVTHEAPTAATTTVPSPVALPAPKGPSLPAPPAPQSPVTPPSEVPSHSAERLEAAKTMPIVTMFRAKPAPLVKSKPYIDLDWPSGGATPGKIFQSGTYTLYLNGINDILYRYDFQVMVIESSTDDLSRWADLIKKTMAILPEAGVAKGAPPNACLLIDRLNSAKTRLDTLNQELDAMLPKKPGGGKYPSIPLSQTLAQWAKARKAYDDFETQVKSVQNELISGRCNEQHDLEQLALAEHLILESYKQMQDRAITLQAKADANHVAEYPTGLERTSKYEVHVRETYESADTDVSPNPKVFNLNPGYSVLTLSGGFLLTELQARSYTSRTAPASGGGTQNVLGVDGGSGIRPVLVALFNYHNPFGIWPERPNLGLALSAGPVIDVSNGKADTSRFGFFGGVSLHLWHRLFITPGVHVGEFADFPVGFVAGQVIPANTGTPTPVKRFTARFALAITFKGSDLSGLGGKGGEQSGAETGKGGPKASGKTNP